MTAFPRDPNFWKRFSRAVHQDEESKRPELKHTESWLEEQRRKRKKRTYMCWCFWLVFISLVVGVVVTIIVLRREGILP